MTVVVTVVVTIVVSILVTVLSDATSFLSSETLVASSATLFSASDKSAVLRWLKADLVKSSTPVHSVGERKSSNKSCEVNCDVSGGSIEAVSESLEPLKESEVVTASESATNMESVNPSSDQNMSEFDSTTSWFLSNVNSYSYCASMLKGVGENEDMVKETEVESIGSTTRAIS